MVNYLCQRWIPDTDQPGRREVQLPGHEPKEGTMYQLGDVETAELKAHIERANKARREGVKLLRDRVSGQHFATSASRPFVNYYVTLFSCSCPGFITHGHCKHNSALVVAHLLQEGHSGEPEEAPCHACNGSGQVQEQRARWIGGSKLGYRSTWMVEVPCTACAEAAVAA